MSKGGFNKFDTSANKPKVKIHAYRAKEVKVAVKAPGEEPEVKVQAQQAQQAQAQQAQAEEVKAQAQAQTAPQAEEVKAEAQSQTVPQTEEVKAEAQPQSTPEAEEVKVEAQTQTAPEAEEVQAEENKAEAETEAKAETNTETETEAKAETEAKKEVKVEPVKPFLTYSARDFSTAVHKELPELLKKLKTEELSEKELRRLHKEGYQFLSRFNDGVCSTLSIGNERVLRAISLYKERLEELPKQLERASRDTETAGRFANEKLVKGPIKTLVETLNLSLEKLPKNSEDANFVDFLAKLKELDNSLRANLEKHKIFIFGKVGETFDVNLHEAIAQYPAPSDEQKGKIAYVSNEGFKIEDRVIEPAKVVVYLED